MSKGDLEKSQQDEGSHDHGQNKSRDLYLDQEDGADDEDMEDDEDDELDQALSEKDNRDEEFTLRKS